MQSVAIRVTNLAPLTINPFPRLKILSDFKFLPDAGCRWLIFFCRGFKKHIKHSGFLDISKTKHIYRTCAQSAAFGAPNSSYFSNTCAKCCGLSSGFVVFLEHVCKVQPASRPDRSRFWISGTLVWEAVHLIHGCN